MPATRIALASSSAGTRIDIAYRTLAASFFSVLLSACGDRDTNFSQYPGFAEWYRENPPSAALPTSEEQALLRRYLPRFHLPADHEGPIDFYRDYIADGQLVDGEGALIGDAVTEELLNAHKSDPAVVFTHIPAKKETSPTVYGRITTELADWPGCAEPIPLTFLAYHLVFRSSGLPAGVPVWQTQPLSLVADLDDWHQLDHYTAVTIALLPAGLADDQATVAFAASASHTAPVLATEPVAPVLVTEPVVLALTAPVAVTFQQHNYQRTYLLGEEKGAGRLALPDDGRIEIDIAIRSNELYPHQPEPSVRRAMSFMDPDGARYIVGEGKAPWLAADDITDPTVAIEPELAFLPPDDAFYVFQGWLGERRRLPGRDGPPGADYNTLPSMKPLVHQMALSYWHEGDLAWLDLYLDLFQDGWPDQIDPTDFIEKMAKDLDPICEQPTTGPIKEAPRN